MLLREICSSTAGQTSACRRRYSASASGRSRTTWAWISGMAGTLVHAGRGVRAAGERVGPLGAGERAAGDGARVGGPGGRADVPAIGAVGVGHREQVGAVGAERRCEGAVRDARERRA